MHGHSTAEIIAAIQAQWRHDFPDSALPLEPTHTPDITSTLCPGPTITAFLRYDGEVQSDIPYQFDPLYTLTFTITILRQLQSQDTPPYDETANSLYAALSHIQSWLYGQLQPSQDFQSEFPTEQTSQRFGLQFTDPAGATDISVTRLPDIAVPAYAIQFSITSSKSTFTEAEPEAVNLIRIRINNGAPVQTYLRPNYIPDEAQIPVPYRISGNS